ncbi:MAG: hypothetical protein HYX94_07310 [Chloroflexi bacterium]|nr:hypothetical protein [Chloroflexota bacterium]
MTHHAPYEDYEEHVAEMEHGEPAFLAERERLRPGFELGRALIAARLAAGLTQKQLAHKMGKANTSPYPPSVVQRGTNCVAVVVPLQGLAEA